MNATIGQSNRPGMTRTGLIRTIQPVSIHNRTGLLSRVLCEPPALGCGGRRYNRWLPAGALRRGPQCEALFGDISQGETKCSSESERPRLILPDRSSHSYRQPSSSYSRRRRVSWRSRRQIRTGSSSQCTCRRHCRSIKVGFPHRGWIAQ